jgi:hypothetical protein
MSNPFSTLDPAAEAYAPPGETLSVHCEALKDLILFMRNTGVRCESLEVGKNGVRLIGFVDDYPRKANAQTRETPPPTTMDARDDLFSD